MLDLLTWENYLERLCFIGVEALVSIKYGQVLCISIEFVKVVLGVEGQLQVGKPLNAE